MKLVIESVYVLWSPQFPWHGKIGIAGNVEERRKSIEQQLRQKFGDHVRVKRLLSLPIITSAYNFEQAIHNALDGMPYWRCETMRGTNGWTEWRWCANFIIAILAYFYAYAMNWNCGAWCSLVALLLPLPLDFALYVALLAGAEYAAAAGLVYLAYNFLT